MITAFNRREQLKFYDSNFKVTGILNLINAIIQLTVFILTIKYRLDQSPNIF